MKLSALLYSLSLILKLSIFRFSEFKEHLKKKDFTGVIKTMDGKASRYYTFKGGRVKSKSGSPSNADFTMVWKDAESAFRIMAGGDQLAFMKAISDGTVKTEGDSNLAVWFLLSLEKMASFYKKKK